MKMHLVYVKKSFFKYIHIFLVMFPKNLMHYAHVNLCARHL